MMSLTSSGLVRTSIEVTIELMHDDFPAPVAPAISRWGSSERLSSRGRPLMSIPKPDFERVGVSGGLAAAEHVSQRHQPALPVGHLDPDGAPPRDRCQQPHVRSRQGVCDVMRQTRHPVHLYPGRELDLVTGHCRSGDDLGEPSIDTVLDQGVLQYPGGLLQRSPALLLTSAQRKQVERR